MGSISRGVPLRSKRDNTVLPWPFPLIVQRRIRAAPLPGAVQGYLSSELGVVIHPGWSLKQLACSNYRLLVGNRWPARSWDFGVIIAAIT